MIKEKDLVENINTYLSSNNNLFANEVRMGIGIPDIMVYLSRNTNTLYLRDYYHLKLINEINDNNLHSLESVYKKINLPKRRVIQLLEELVSLEILMLTNDNVYFNKEIDFSKQGVNISIEVKIKDWKSGLLQAQRYLSFSDYSYLAIKSVYVKNIDIQLAQELGIGIISINDDKIEEVFKPGQSEYCNQLFKNISLSYLSIQENKHLNNTFFSLSS